MATIATSSFHEQGGEGLSPSAAIRRAWIAWLVMLVIPFIVFIIAVWYSAWIGADRQPGTINSVWFVIGMLYLIFIVPASLFWRSHVFKAYWQGHVVPPRLYLNGMLSVWVALEVSGIFSLIGCMVGGSLIPNLLPALVAFMFYVILWPNGHAMSRTVGASDDHAIYEEPR